MKIGKLEPVPLRELWKHEERGFSAWLAENLQTLADTLGLRLSDAQRSVTAGAFTVDLVAEDDSSGRVIIENQLEATDHDHLGKILTYLTNLDAKTAIWITKNPRPEHVRAVAWLNETTPDDISFYLVQIAAYRIADSTPAPLFTIIAGPSPEAKGFGRQKKDMAERHVLRLKFWESLLSRAKEKGVLIHSSRSPVKDAWISAGAGKSGLSFNYVIWMEDEGGVELYIDTGDAVENKKIFDALHSKKDHIEKSYGGPLNWERLDGKRACRIRDTIRKGGLSSGESNWPVVQDAMIDAMRRLDKALRTQIKSGA
jgi:hypothetical protein